MRVRVDVGSRLHLGFQNLSLAHERLYGGLGVALESPAFVIEAEPADRIVCDQPLFAEYAERSCELLAVSGIELDILETLPRHVGLGSGTQTALATFLAIASAYGESVSIREHAPELNRGGRSGIGVATFESGGFIVDTGHPTERFTTDPPMAGEWTVPAVAVRHELPPSWRFLVVLPDVEPGRSGDGEDESMRTVVENADPSVADSIATLLIRRLLPAVAEHRLESFGDAIGALGRLNGAWYADEQGGVYRPPAGRIIDALSEKPAVRGIGQSSWGPAVYGVTDTSRADEAVSVAEQTLSDLDLDGTVQIAAPRNHGVNVTQLG